ncbi:hypothetical protein AS850_11060 [Frondihabitans sp. 762G35]|uniref:hypothetical protein n=1 Tax=Frondihabitans sp. 762G35 TaxID=1446794 RepID=UPI000D20AD06|nr:hypothetical protein [Frondihabitans sp. 762G35]ARC57610.1 hypothetical protein AS850_11060 [Frondihabitans sp. 762G35]
MASLIQRRMAIDRIVITGRWQIVGGAAFLGIGAFELLTSGFHWPVLGQIAIGAVGLGRGILLVRRGRRERQAFESIQGEDAGRQRSVSR